MTLQREPLSPDQPVIILRRTFQAPRSVVWQVLTTPAHVAQWYGGHGFTNPVCEMDVRPGGLWRHVMRTPDGSEFRMEFEFVEVVPPAKLVWRSVAPAGHRREGPFHSEMTVTLEDAGPQTHWKLVTRFATVKDRDEAAKMGFIETLAEGCEKVDTIAQSLAGR